MRLLPLFVALVATVAWAAPAEAASKVAVVDLVTVMREHPGAETIKQQFTKNREEAEANLQSARELLDGLKKKLEKAAEESPEREQLERQYQLQANTMKFNYEWAVKSAVRQYARALERLYSNVRGHVAKYARDNGIEIVLVKMSTTEPMRSIDQQDFALKSRLRTVIYSDARVDITDAILQVVKSQR